MLTKLLEYPPTSCVFSYVIFSTHISVSYPLFPHQTTFMLRHMKRAQLIVFIAIETIIHFTLRRLFFILIGLESFRNHKRSRQTPSHALTPPPHARRHAHRRSERSDWTGGLRVKRKGPVKSGDVTTVLRHFVQGDGLLQIAVRCFIVFLQKGLFGPSFGTSLSHSTLTQRALLWRP